MLLINSNLLNVNKVSFNDVSFDCIKMAKSKTFPFPMHDPLAPQCFDLVQSDEWVITLCYLTLILSTLLPLLMITAGLLGFIFNTLNLKFLKVLKFS